MNTGYQIGRWLAKHRYGIFWFALALGAAAAVSFKSNEVRVPHVPPKPKPDAAAIRAQQEQEEAKARQVREEQCKGPLLAEARNLVAEKKPVDAYVVIGGCEEYYAADKQAKSLFASVQAASEAEDRRKREARAAAERKRLAAEKAEKKRSGVHLGMSQQDVVDSSWGKPRKINRTIGSYGVHEQWVYDGGYLYFKNGVLETIQN